MNTAVKHQIRHIVYSCLFAALSVGLALALLISLDSGQARADAENTELCPSHPFLVQGDICAVYAAYAYTQTINGVVVTRTDVLGKPTSPELKLIQSCLPTPYPTPCAPISTEVSYDTFQRFENGMIIRNADEGTAFALFNDILDTYDDNDYLRNSTPGGDLGLPITSEIGNKNNCKAYFEKGMIDCNASKATLWKDMSSPDQIHEKIHIPTLKWPWNKGTTGNYTGGPHEWVPGYASGIDVNLHISPTWNVAAMTSGTVVGVNNYSGCEGENDTTGCWIAIRSDFSGVVLIYGHIPPDTLVLRVGDHVRQGNIIGKIRSGENVGRCDGVSCIVHLHIELRDGTQNLSFCSGPNHDQCKKYGNPISWHGIKVDDYLISSSFSNPDAASKSFWDYQGTAVKGVPLADNSKYLQGNLVSELNSRGYVFSKNTYIESYKDTNNNTVTKPHVVWTWMTSQAYDYCKEQSTSYGDAPRCEYLPDAPHSTYFNTVFADDSSRGYITPTVNASGAASIQFDPMQSLLLSTNHATTYVPRFTIPYPPSPVPSSPGSNACPTDGQPGVYFYSGKQYGGVCYFATSNVSAFATTSLYGRQVTSVKIIGSYQAKLRTADNRSREINRPGIEDLSKDSTYASSYVAADVSSLLDDTEVSNVSSATSAIGREYRFESSCSVGTKYYTDRSQTIQEFNQSAAQLNGLPCIATANDDKQNGNRGLLSFEISKPARIYILADSRTTRFPSIFRDPDKYQRKGGWEVKVSGSDMGHFEVLACDSKAGRIVLPGPKYDGGDGSNSMYVVMIDASVSDGTKKCGVDAPGAPILTSPPDGAAFESGANPIFAWQDSGDQYELLITDDAGLEVSSGWINTNSYAVHGLSVGHSYQWSVRARDFVQIGKPSETRTFVVRPPLLSIHNAGFIGRSAVLAWTADKPVLGYRIYRNGEPIRTFLTNYSNRYLDMGSPFLMDAGEALFSDLEFETNIRYIYEVRALVDNVESASSNQITIFLPDLDGDFVTSLDDIYLLLDFLFNGVGTPPPGYDPTGDGIVDLRDVIEFVKYLEPAPSASASVLTASASRLRVSATGIATTGLNFLGTYQTAGQIKDGTFAGSIAYLLGQNSDSTGAMQSFVQAVDLSNPQNPRVLGTVSLAGSAGQIVIDGNLAAVTTVVSTLGAEPKYTLTLIDVTLPNALRVRSSVAAISGAAQQIDMKNGFGYIAAGNEGVHIFDLRNPDSPAPLLSRSTGTWTAGVEIVGGLAYLIDEASGLLVWDIANPSEPVELSRSPVVDNPLAIVVRFPYVYIAIGIRGVEVFDVTNAAKPYPKTFYEVGSATASVSLIGVNLVMSNGWDGIRVLDVGNPNTPSVVGEADPSIGYTNRVRGSEDRIYSVDDLGGLHILQVTSPISRLYLPAVTNMAAMSTTPPNEPTPAPTSTPIPTPTPTLAPTNTPTPAATPVLIAGPTFTPTPTATPWSLPQVPPTATLLGVAHSSECEWKATLRLEGFSPFVSVTIASAIIELDCATGVISTSQATQLSPVTTDADGTALIEFTRSGQGSYSYMFTDGSGRSATVTYDNFPEFAFVSGADGDNEIYSMNVGGNELKRLTDNSAIDEGPSWSGDGKHLVFHSNVSGRNQLYVMDADGTNCYQLFDSIFTDEWPYWSPDSEKIAFSRVADHDATGVVHAEVFVTSADGTNAQRLTFNGTPSLSADHSCWPSGWSRDSTQILFYCYTNGTDSIWTMNFDGSNQRQVISDSFWSAIPTMAPNGTQIVFSCYEFGTWDVFVANADGSERLRLTNGNLTDWRPSFSPNGRKIIYEYYGDGKNQIFIMNPDGSLQQQVVAAGDAAGQPVWRPEP